MVKSYNNNSKKKSTIRPLYGQCLYISEAHDRWQILLKSEKVIRTKAPRPQVAVGIRWVDSRAMECLSQFWTQSNAFCSYVNLLTSKIATCGTTKTQRTFISFHFSEKITKCVFWFSEIVDPYLLFGNSWVQQDGCRSRDQNKTRHWWSWFDRIQARME